MFKHLPIKKVCRFIDKVDSNNFIRTDNDYKILQIIAKSCKRTLAYFICQHQPANLIYSKCTLVNCRCCSFFYCNQNTPKGLCDILLYFIEKVVMPFKNRSLTFLFSFCMNYGGVRRHISREDWPSIKKWLWKIFKSLVVVGKDFHPSISLLFSLLQYNKWKKCYLKCFFFVLYLLSFGVKTARWRRIHSAHCIDALKRTF